MSAKERTIEVPADDLTDAVAVMDELAAARRGWINVTPAGVDPPKPQSVWGRINGRGPDVPRLTWTAPVDRRGRVEPAQLGIEHPTGPKALPRLAAAGHPLPDGWRRTQDNPMRGVVVVPDPGAAHADVLDWGLVAVQMLTGPPASGRWSVRVLGTG